MNRNDTIIVEKVKNGYIVKPFGSKGEFFLNADITVFQDKGIVSNERDNQETKDTLFGFLDLHFSEPLPQQSLSEWIGCAPSNQRPIKGGE